MSSQHGNKTAEEGAITPVWLALQESATAVPDGYYTEKKQSSW